MSKKNPINKDEKEAADVVGKRVEPDIETDAFDVEEAAEIVKMVLDDVEAGVESQKPWLKVKEKELLHIANAKPSQIEDLKKRDWMSDRNLGLLPGILDIYQATLLSTCYNPDSIHYLATEDNDVDSRDNLTKFSKWGLGKNESNAFPDIDDFISNRVAHGFSCLKVIWEVKYIWIDKRIPKYSKVKGKEQHIVGYDIKTEKRRFERGVIKNIDNIDDVIVPSYGKDIQELEYFVERLHLSYNDLCDLAAMKVIMNFDKDKFMSTFKNKMIDMDTLRAKKLQINKFDEVSTDRLTNAPIDIYEWYGWYEKNGKKERYRFQVEPVTETLLSGKPLRKINRDGRIPYSGGPLRRIPGMLRGGSLTMLIASLINALNNNYNQTSDFQYIQNMPFGFANLSEFSRKGVHELEPGIVFNVDESPINEKVYFPNLSRSLAWSYQDKEFLMQMIERLTGAASYFLTTDSKQNTATRDAIVNEKSETKFGLWVKRIQEDICEAVNMWVALYQENAPRGLATRILGEDGKRLFKNLSIDDLRGRYDSQMTPDITNGSKVFEKQIKLWGLDLTSKSIWFAPQVNPRGNWMLTKEAMKAMGIQDAEKYLPPMPKADQGSSDEVKNEFQLMVQGEVIAPPPEGITPQVVEHYAGHLKQKEERFHELPEEYRPNFDAHLFATYVNYMEFIKKSQLELQAQKLALAAINKIKEAAQMPEQGVMSGSAMSPEVGSMGDNGGGITAETGMQALPPDPAIGGMGAGA